MVAVRPIEVTGVVGVLILHTTGAEGGGGGERKEGRERERKIDR